MLFSPPQCIYTLKNENTTTNVVRHHVMSWLLFGLKTCEVNHFRLNYNRHKMISDKKPATHRRKASASPWCTWSIILRVWTETKKNVQNWAVSKNGIFNKAVLFENVTQPKLVFKWLFPSTLIRWLLYPDWLWQD